MIKIKIILIMLFNSCPNNRRHKDSLEFLWRNCEQICTVTKKQAGKWPWSSSPPCQRESPDTLCKMFVSSTSVPDVILLVTTKILSAQVRVGVVDEGVNEHLHAQASRLSSVYHTICSSHSFFLPSLVNKNCEKLEVLLLGRWLLLDPVWALHPFPHWELWPQTC